MRSNDQIFLQKKNKDNQSKEIDFILNLSSEHKTVMDDDTNS